MSYTPSEWETGDVVTAEKLNNIESGITGNETDIAANAGDIDTLEAAVATNTQNIAANAGDIDTLEAAVAALPTPASRIKDDSSNNGGVVIGTGDATGSDSLSIGIAHATGARSLAIGTATSESANSLALGVGSKTQGAGSVAIGNNAKTSRDSCLSSGAYTEAVGINSTCFGERTRANGKDQFVCGVWNTPQGSPTALTDTDYLFIIGNGNSSSQTSNALAIKKDGTFVFANGTEITPAQFASLLALLTPA